MPVLNYTEDGNGPPLIIIHGLFGSLSNWKTISREFSAHYRVITPDLRNHGASFHSDTMSYEEMADDILSLLQTLSISRVHILGHSMGGKVAMLLALRHPDVVMKLIVADIAPVTYNDNHTEIIDAMLEMDIDSYKQRSDADLQLSESISDVRVRQFLLQNLLRSNNHFGLRINLQSIKKNIQQIMSFPVQYCPENNAIESLFIAGEFSDYLSNESIALTKNCFPNAVFKTVKNTGHWLHAEKPVAFSQLVRDFLLQ